MSNHDAAMILCMGFVLAPGLGAWLGLWFAFLYSDR